MESFIQFVIGLAILLMVAEFLFGFISGEPGLLSQ